MSVDFEDFWFLASLPESVSVSRKRTFFKKEKEKRRTSDIVNEGDKVHEGYFTFEKN
jgi:hypothetical protein